MTIKKQLKKEWRLSSYKQSQS